MATSWRCVGAAVAQPLRDGEQALRIFPVGRVQQAERLVYGNAQKGRNLCGQVLVVAFLQNAIDHIQGIGDQLLI